MVVIVLTACPAGLRGHLTRWLLEISAGVFVGRVSARIRDHLWSQVTTLLKDGKAILVHSTKGEQGLNFRVHRHEWQPKDFDGIKLMNRPTARKVTHKQLRRGWSKASRTRQNKRRKTQ